MGSLLTAIAARLEANPSDPRPSLGVWGVVVALGVAVAIVVGRSPMTISQPAPLEIATDITTDITTPPATPEPFPLEPTPPDPNLDSPSSIAATDLDTVLDSDLASEIESETKAETKTNLDRQEPAEPATFPQEPRLLDDREPLPEIPAELTAPNPSLRLEPAPPPLTPEQRLVAALQERIKMVSEEYIANEIVTTVRIDFAQNHLDVELMDRWYDLDEAEQDRLATDLRDRGQQFDFYDIDIVDAAGQLVARPATIGDAMIIVRRVRS